MSESGVLATAGCVREWGVGYSSLCHRGVGYSRLCQRVRCWLQQAVSESGVLATAACVIEVLATAGCVRE